jgi:hypothetical protein
MSKLEFVAGVELDSGPHVKIAVEYGQDPDLGPGLPFRLELHDEDGCAHAWLSLSDLAVITRLIQWATAQHLSTGPELTAELHE